MVEYLSRSAWTSTARGGGILTDRALIGCSVHYPASGNIVMAGMTREQVAQRLRGWYSFHVNTRGWSDIGYQVAIDGAGRVWDLRGITRIPAASASESNPDANLEWGACLFVVGNSEPPTPAAVAAFQHWRTTRWLRQWPGARQVRGHGQVPGASTSCPGSRLRALIADGTLLLPPTGGVVPPAQPRKAAAMAMTLIKGRNAFRLVTGDRIVGQSRAAHLAYKAAGVPAPIVPIVDIETLERVLTFEGPLDGEDATPATAADLDELDELAAEAAHLGVAPAALLDRAEEPPASGTGPRPRKRLSKIGGRVRDDRGQGD